MYTKRAVKYNESVPYVDCECHNKLALNTNPKTCLCGITYDSRGWIIDRPDLDKPAHHATVLE